MYHHETQNIGDAKKRHSAMDLEIPDTIIRRCPGTTVLELSSRR